MKITSQLRSFLFLILLHCCFIGNAQHTINIKNLGAKGDGVTDDYNAFRLLADTVNALGGAEIIFPEGNYYLAPFHTADNSIKDIVFMNCNGIKIKGNKACITVNGNFLRTINRHSGRNNYSKTRAVVPLDFRNCKNIRIEDLEINGHVDQMVREYHVVESGTHLIRLAQCQHVNISNVKLHHAESDGMYIIGDSSYDVNVSNSDFSNNGRQGLSVIGLQKGYFYKCRFINTGITDGKYVRHNPSDGVDIEPRYLVKDITFEACTFANNLGGQFICTSPSKTSGIHLKDCKIVADSSKRIHQMILYANDLTIDQCDIDCGSGAIYATWNQGYNCKVEIKNSVIKSSTYGIFGVANDSSNCTLSVHNNKFFCTADTLICYMPCLRIPNLSFINNEFIFSAHAINTPDGYCALVGGRGIFANNKLTTLNNGIKPVVNTGGLKEPYKKEE